MKNIDLLSNDDKFNPNKVIKALRKDCFPDLKNSFIYSRFNSKQDITEPLINYFRLIGLSIKIDEKETFNYKKYFSFISIDPIIQGGHVGCLIGGLAHELSHIVLDMNGAEKYDNKEIEYYTDQIVVERGLGRYLCAFNLFYKHVFRIRGYECNTDGIPLEELQICS